MTMRSIREATQQDACARIDSNQDFFSKVGLNLPWSMSVMVKDSMMEAFMLLAGTRVHNSLGIVWEWEYKKTILSLYVFWWVKLLNRISGGFC